MRKAQCFRGRKKEPTYAGSSFATQGPSTLVTISTPPPHQQISEIIPQLQAQGKLRSIKAC